MSSATSVHHVLKIVYVDSDGWTSVGEKLSGLEFDSPMDVRGGEKDPAMHFDLKFQIYRQCPSKNCIIKILFFKLNSV